MRLVGSLRRPRRHRDINAPAAPGLEGDRAFFRRKNRVVAPHADIAAGMIFRAALAHDDIAGDHGFTAEFFDAEAAAFGIAPVARGTAGFLMGHLSLSLRAGDDTGDL